MKFASTSAIFNRVHGDAYRLRLKVFLASRDVGTALTLGALRAGISLTAVTAAAKDLGEYVDDALAIVRDEYKPRLDCREGCAYCCCKPGVLVSLPELVLVLARIRATPSGEGLAGLRERGRRYALQIRGRSFNASVNESVPCPLLVDDRCSVYAVRGGTRERTGAGAARPIRTARKGRPASARARTRRCQSVATAASKVR